MPKRRKIMKEEKPRTFFCFPSSLSIFRVNSVVEDKDSIFKGKAVKLLEVLPHMTLPLLVPAYMSLLLYPRKSMAVNKL